MVEPESYKNISLESPLPDNIRDEEPAIILQNFDKGYLYENNLQIVEGVFDHSDKIQTLIFNPNPYAVEIPADIPVACGSTLAAVNGRLESNELIEVRDDPDHLFPFKHQYCAPIHFQILRCNTFLYAHFGVAL